MNTIIREAKVEDLAALYELNSVVHELHISFNVGIFKETTRSEVVSWFKQVLSDEMYFIFIAEVNDSVAGYILCRRDQKASNIFLNARSSVYIEQIAVSKDCRKLGISRLLIERVNQLARQHGISKVQLDVWSQNEVAYLAFKSLGFKTYNRKMELSLD